MRSLTRLGWFAALGAALLGTLLVFVGVAQAAFPGRDGLLAVQPLKGSGIVLVEANGRRERRVCATPATGAASCSLVRPQWSPDGQKLAVAAPSPGFEGSVDVIYPDGSCLNCQMVFEGLRDVAFTSDPTLLTGWQGGLIEFGIDGTPKSFPRAFRDTRVSDLVGSSRGELALVRRGWIWAGRPGKLRRLTRGSAPSWSPDGRRIVFARRGWLMIVVVRGRRVRRLVRGTAPAWSPDGRWIAFFDGHHRLSVVQAKRGRVRRVGRVTGRTVDWQPLPARPPAVCLAPPGSTVAASGDTATITVDSGFGLWVAMGCLRADGRQRVLATSGASGPPPNWTWAVAGHYAALLSIGRCGRIDESRWSASVEVFDLRTGAQVPGRGGESAAGPGFTGDNASTCQSSMDQLVLGSDAVSAVHIALVDNGCTCTVEQIQASDSTGVHTLDSVTEADGSPTALTNLTLTGDTLTWQHNGSPKSAQLQP